MIERKFVSEKIREFQIQEYVKNSLRNSGLSHVKMQKTPLGEKITVYTSRPGLVVGRKGQNIKQMTKVLKKEFDLENPQIEISEVGSTGLNASIMSENVAAYLEKFGTKNFKGIGHKIMTNVMNSGALGVEIILSGKIPSSRAKSWRFYSGYLRKCGDASIEGIDRAYAIARLKSGIVGIKLSIMPPDIKLPDDIKILDEKETVVEEVKEGEKGEDKTIPQEESAEKENEEGKASEAGEETKEKKKGKKRERKSKKADVNVKEEKDETKGIEVNE